MIGEEGEAGESGGVSEGGPGVGVDSGEERREIRSMPAVMLPYWSFPPICRTPLYKYVSIPIYRAHSER